MTKKELKKYGKAFNDKSEIGFTFFWNKFYPELHKYARIQLATRSKYSSDNYLHTSKDILQDVFMHTYEIITPGKFISASQIRCYLYAAVRNKTINYLTSKYNSTEPLTGDMDVIDTFTVDKMIMQAEVTHIIQKEIDVLPGQCRTTMVFHYVYGKRIMHIAPLMNLSISTIKNNCQSGLGKMKKRITKSTVFPFNNY